MNSEKVSGTRDWTFLQHVRKILSNPSHNITLPVRLLIVIFYKQLKVIMLYYIIWKIYRKN
jgi:hypothetical protein